VADAISVNVEIESQEVDDLVHDWKSPRFKIPVSNQYGVAVPTTDKINDMVIIIPIIRFVAFRQHPTFCVVLCEVKGCLSSFWLPPFFGAIAAIGLLL
jgi:hypothetical protein